MNSVLSLAFFLLAPLSFSHNISVSFQGKIFQFNKHLYEKIVLADSSDVEKIFELSKQLPSLYPKEIPSEPLAFRTRDIYQRLLKGEDIRANALKQKHTLLVFKDEKGVVQGYIHGWVDSKTNEATIDELVVDAEWRKQKVAHTLIGKLLVYFESSRSSVTVTSRIPFSKALFDPFEIKLREKDFDTIFIVDHLLSRFSLRYLKYENRTAPPKHQAVADELHQIISNARGQDALSTDAAMSYLRKLVLVMNKEIKNRKAGKDFYSGIQEDKYDIANVYFVRMVMSFFSKKDPGNSRRYYEFREIYLKEISKELEGAQEEKGIFEMNLQLFIARLYAFVPYLQQEEKGSLARRQWIQKSVEEYLKLVKLPDVHLYPAFIQAMICEILWFQYEYTDALKIAAIFMKYREEALAFLKEKENLMTQEKEMQMALLFKNLQAEIWKEWQVELKPEWGLLFFYVINFYPKEEKAEKAMHPKIGKIFSETLVYSDRDFSLDFSLPKKQGERLKKLIEQFKEPLAVSCSL